MVGIHFIELVDACLVGIVAYGAQWTVGNTLSLAASVWRVYAARFVDSSNKRI